VSTPNPITPVINAAWQTYQAGERGAQMDYYAAIEEAQRHFTADVAPAIDTYHRVERAAWQAYLMTSRAARRRYLEAAGIPAADQEGTLLPVPAPTVAYPTRKPATSPTWVPRSPPHPGRRCNGPADHLRPLPGRDRRTHANQRGRR